MNALNTEKAIQILNDRFNTLSERDFYQFQESFIEAQEAEGVHPNDICTLLDRVAFLVGLYR